MDSLEKIANELCGNYYAYQGCELFACANDDFTRVNNLIREPTNTALRADLSPIWPYFVFIPMIPIVVGFVGSGLYNSCRTF